MSPLKGLGVFAMLGGFVYMVTIIADVEILMLGLTITVITVCVVIWLASIRRSHMDRRIADGRVVEKLVAGGATSVGFRNNTPSDGADIRHYDVIQAALEGRCSEAAELAAIGEREDITAYGINSVQAVSWLSTRARVADVCGSPEQAVQLRAAVARVDKTRLTVFER